MCLERKTEEIGEIEQARTFGCAEGATELSQRACINLLAISGQSIFREIWEMNGPFEDPWMQRFNSEWGKELGER
jgi:hypothetical protein